MSFTQTQVRKLRSRLQARHVRTREAEGISLSYLEGWHVLSEANRIFGFDGWDRETVSSECVWTKQVNGRFCAAYVTRIRIRVRAGDAVITREGSGAGESSAASPGQAHEFAAKAAETDATKRALMTFGNAFGLSLYGGTAETRSKGQHQGSGTSLGGKPEVMQSEENGDVTAAVSETRSDSVVASPVDTPADVGGASERPVYSLPVTLPGPDWPQIRPLDEAARLNDDRKARIDKSTLALSEPRRERNSGHLAFVASKPCLICGRNRAHGSLRQRLLHAVGVQCFRMKLV